MFDKFYILIAFLFLSNFTYSQAVSDSLIQLGNTFYKKEQYSKAAPLWFKGAETADNKITKQTNYFYAADAYANAKDSINSFKCLELAIRQNGYNDLPALKSDDAFKFMNTSKRWITLINSIKPTYTTDPLKVKIVDSDVKNFWQAFDMVKKDSSKAAFFYKKYYIDKGTLALQDYYVNKLNGYLPGFVYVHSKKVKFYKSIRANTNNGTIYKKEYTKSFLALKNIYPEAIFPNVYFVIGKLNSAGTSGSNGLVLAIDQICKTKTTNTSELESWELHYINGLDNIAHVVAHELIHFQQNGMASDTTLLKASILEGMADFIGELMSGSSANVNLQVFAKGKEKIIWQKFKSEMYLDKAKNWVSNGDQDKPEWPADLGYWVGYEICKSYYANATDKKKAIYDMLHIQDYNKFFSDSKFEEKANAW